MEKNKNKRVNSKTKQKASVAAKKAPLDPIDLTPQQLEELITKLNCLCLEIDPYNELTSTQKETLNSVGIYQFDDPFLLTNQLVALLEDAIEWRMKKQ